jgi:hypothetical protein
MTTESVERDTRLQDAELAIRQNTLRKMELFSTLSEDERMLI